MPAFQWNLVMCFIMGLAAGGMLPVTYALLAECIPTQHRGWTLVLVGAFGLIGGWFAASDAIASEWTRAKTISVGLSKQPSITASAKPFEKRGFN